MLLSISKCTQYAFGDRAPAEPRAPHSVQTPDPGTGLKGEIRRRNEGVKERERDEKGRVEGEGRGEEKGRIEVREGYDHQCKIPHALMYTR